MVERQFSPEQLAEVLWAVVQVPAFSGATQLIKKLQNTAARALEHFSPSDLALLLEAYALSGALPPPDHLHEICTQIESSIDGFEPAHVCMVLESFATLRDAPPDSLVVTLGQRILVSVQLYKPVHVAGLMYALGTLRLDGNQHLQSALCARTQELCAKCVWRGSEVVRTIWGFAALGMSSGREVVLAALIQQV